MVGTGSILSLSFLIAIKIGRMQQQLLKNTMGMCHTGSPLAEFKLATIDGSRLGNMIDTGHSKIVQENCEYMRAVVVSLCYTAYQGIVQQFKRRFCKLWQIWSEVKSLQKSGKQNISS